MYLYFKFQYIPTKNGWDMHFWILKIVIFGVWWRHATKKLWKILFKLTNNIFMYLNFKFQYNPTTNGWGMHFWILKNCHFSEAISAYLEAPDKKTNSNLRKALDVNFLVLEGKSATTNRSLVTAPNVKTSKMRNFGQNIVFFDPTAPPGGFFWRKLLVDHELREFQSFYGDFHRLFWAYNTK